MQDFLNVEMTDEQIMDLLVEALQDITGFDEDITKETLLIDELGLDSLGFFGFILHNSNFDPTGSNKRANAKPHIRGIRLRY